MLTNLGGQHPLDSLHPLPTLQGQREVSELRHDGQLVREPSLRVRQEPAFVDILRQPHDGLLLLLFTRARLRLFDGGGDAFGFLLSVSFGAYSRVYYALVRARWEAGGTIRRLDRIGMSIVPRHG